ncbi:MAG: glycosyltransferase family 1 protein [Chitinophagaceae bacterium]|nr:MAG: glycosyltransferase family 1 protein [Chitinophagaceae bacterium]
MMNIICFSHLRWEFVYQRPQHLLSRAAELFPVFFIEEPMFHDGADWLEIKPGGPGVQVMVPRLSHRQDDSEITEAVTRLLEAWDQTNNDSHIAWFYTPMAVPLLDAFAQPEVIVYDCMDELSAFKNAPVQLVENEKRLLEIADVVFTGGQSLFEAKRNLHNNIHPFPSSIDRHHFGSARTYDGPEPADQLAIPHPRIGFFGVIDERLDIELLRELAEKRPDWHLVLIGPVVKIDEASLPRLANIHYLGGKTYPELPAYLSGWDVAIIPFAINESTRFISPTKTPEYLAGGKPVVSTPIRDVVDPYGEMGLVQIAPDAAGFSVAIEKALNQKNDQAWVSSVNRFLDTISWDKTWSGMLNQINNKLEIKSPKTFKKQQIHV